MHYVSFFLLHRCGHSPRTRYTLRLPVPESSPPPKPAPSAARAKDKRQPPAAAARSGDSDELSAAIALSLESSAPDALTIRMVHPQGLIKDIRVDPRCTGLQLICLAKSHFTFPASSSLTASFLDTPLSPDASLAASGLSQRSIVRFAVAKHPLLSPSSTDSSNAAFKSRPSQPQQHASAPLEAGGVASQAPRLPPTKRSKSEPDAGSEWACAACTLVNDVSHARCQACEAPRKAVNPVSAALVSAANAAATTASTSTSDAGSDHNTFTVLTLNLWFDEYHDRLRMSRVAREVRLLLPDFLCLQEVTPKLLSMLDPLLRQLGYSTQSTLRYAYGEMLWWRCARVSYVQLTQEPFHDSQQGRHLHVAQCVVCGHRLAAATVHLESEARNSAVRLAQLGRALGHLRSIGIPFVLAGDTNLGKKDDAVLGRDKAKLQGASDGQYCVAQHKCRSVYSALSPLIPHALSPPQLGSPSAHRPRCPSLGTPCAT